MTVSVSGDAPAVGTTSRFSASASLSNGTSQSVTTQASWQSSDTAVASVSAAGEVTGVNGGNVEIRATYQSVTGALRVTVSSAPHPPRAFHVSGFLHEPSPTEDIVVPAARIEVVGGTLADQVFTSDDRGRFVLSPVTTGDFYLYFKKPGYEDSRFWVKELPRDEAIEVELVPERPITRRWSGTLESSNSGGTITNQIIGWPGDFLFETRRTASVSLTFEVGCIGAAGTYTDFGAVIRTQQTGVEVLDVWTGGYGPPFRTASSRVLPAGRYRLSMMSNGFLGHGCPWTLVLSRPY